MAISIGDVRQMRSRIQQSLKQPKRARKRRAPKKVDPFQMSLFDFGSMAA